MPQSNAEPALEPLLDQLPQPVLAPPPAPRSRADINRANAQKSTGPRTEAGMARSRLNALTHGLTSRDVLILPGEDPSALQRLHDGICQQLVPRGTLEIELVDTIVSYFWRLRRIPNLEAALFATCPEPESGTTDDEPASAAGLLAAAQALHANPRALATLSIHEQRLQRLLREAMSTLAAYQETRRRNEKTEMVRAAGLRMIHNAKKIPFDPAAHGFVFSLAEIDAYIRACDAHEEVKHGVAWNFAPNMLASFHDRKAQNPSRIPPDARHAAEPMKNAA